MGEGWTFAGEATQGGGDSVTLIEGSSFCLSERGGDLVPGTPQGLFHRDTRILSAWQLRLDEEEVDPLSVIAQEPYEALFLGRVTGERKKQLLARARCLLFPLQWEEPFGMVMIEAMVCGTPVVTLRRGSAPEVVADGVTGLIRDDVAELPDAIEAVGALDSRDCRNHVIERFQPDTMAAGYEAVYRKVVGTTAPAPTPLVTRAAREDMAPVA
ncbi:glycosyltransferase [Streptomyces sp. NPDC052701]|uniref:glycosyltransferase n=1 Tax=Streptomyces sp. NPDC052701 TaxID=3155533 RepID=UPI00341AE0BC